MTPTIVFTEHALLHMQRRGISRETVEYALLHRDDDYPVRNDRVARYTLPDNRMLKVRHQVSQDTLVVLAAFFVS